VTAVLDWIGGHPGRARQTLVVVVADHETGGFAIKGPTGTLPGPGTFIRAGWTSGGHTAVDTLVWSQGPGASRLGRALDNIDLYGIVLDAMEGKHGRRRRGRDPVDR
jgi:alkaline phosphatase